MSRAPCSYTTRTAWVREPAVSISSSTIKACLPWTLPMMPIASIWPFFDDCQWCVKTIGQFTCLFGETLVGGDDRKVVHFLLYEVACLEYLRGQFIDRYVEKALDLASVHIHSEDALRTGDSDAVGDEAGRDGDTRLIFLIGAAISIIRNYGGNAGSGGAFEGVYHDQ